MLSSTRTTVSLPAQVAHTEPKPTASERGATQSSSLKDTVVVQLAGSPSVNLGWQRAG